MLSFNGFRSRLLGFLPQFHVKHGPPLFSAVGLDGAAMLLLANLIIAATGGIALGFWLARVYRVARNTPSDTSHGGCMLVLGQHLRDGAPTPEYGRRLARALALCGAGRILIVGGPPGSRISEARAGRDWLVAHGADMKKIMIEEESQNTLENLIYARQILCEKREEKVTIISSRYHLARCRTIASGLGLNYLLCASEDKLLIDVYNIRRMIIEAYFLNWYHVGKSWAAITRNQKMLLRIS
jgi:uncharacterized SAM-binding protein YcdF (DUF218 family)